MNRTCEQSLLIAFVLGVTGGCTSAPTTETSSAGNQSSGVTSPSVVPENSPSQTSAPPVGSSSGAGGAHDGDATSASVSSDVDVSREPTTGSEDLTEAERDTATSNTTIDGSPVTESSSSTDASEQASSQSGETSSPVEPQPGECTTSKVVEAQAKGSGPFDVVVETNSDPGIAEGTIYRPAELGGNEKYPIFVWGEGGCSKNGSSNASAMAEIASHGYFVVADGTPGGSGNRTMDRNSLDAMGAPLIAYVDWAISENGKACSAYYQSLDATKIAANGFSCGGLMAQGTVVDPRIVTWGVTSSGMAGATQEFYDAIHTPVLFVEGGPDDVAYEGALQGYEAISQLGVPVMWFDKALGHGGDLNRGGGGDFTKINLAWLNWWLKGDETATGKGLLVGANCPYCSDEEWDVRGANVSQ